MTVPIQSGAGAPRRQPAGKVHADAGDDQVGLVGYRVTLNGSRSTPGDGKGARWIQVAGPALSGAEQKGGFYSFIPTGPGLHRFILVVAGDGEASEPDEVNVLVGYPPAGVPFAAPAAGPTPTPTPNPTPSPTAGNAPEKPEPMLAARLPHLPNGPRVASNIADVLEAVAERVNLYESFAMLESELGRRLDVVVPSTPAERGLWSRGVFQPLAAYTAAELLPAGLDLRTSQGLQQTLTPAQRERLHDHLLNLARRFRAASQAANKRPPAPGVVRIIPTTRMRRRSGLKERDIMRTVWWNRGRTVAATALAAALLAGSGGARPLRAEAQEAAGQLQGVAGFTSALQTSRTRGAATIVVVTAIDQPATARLCIDLAQGEWARSQRGLVQIVGLTKEHDADLVCSLGVTRFPTVFVYARGPKGVGLLGFDQRLHDGRCPGRPAPRIRPGGCRSRPRRSRGAARAMYGDVYPSQQNPPPPPPQPAPAPAPQPAPTLTLAPAAPTPTLTTSAGLIQMPGQNFVIQQGAAQIFVAPAQTPVVYVPQTMNAAPNNTLTLSAAPSQPTPPWAPPWHWRRAPRRRR